jgi:gluconate 2-dehydrogenase gamma chain
MPGGWLFFTPTEASVIEALVDGLIPPDPKFTGGKEAGCAVFIDRQLAGGYGHAEGLYMRGPFVAGTPRQGQQSSVTPAELYRRGLAALIAHAREQFAGKTVAELTNEQRDGLLAALESGDTELPNVDTKAFFAQLLKDTQEGFFSDPLYGGNRDMIAWKMLGYPGARYDLRDWVERHNELYPFPPVSIYKP